MPQSISEIVKDSFQELGKAIGETVKTLIINVYIIPMHLVTISTLLLGVGAARKSEITLKLDDLRLYAYELAPEHPQLIESFLENIAIPEDAYFKDLDIFWDPALYASLAESVELDEKLTVAFNEYLNKVLKAYSGYSLGDITNEGFAEKLTNTLVHRVFAVIKNGITTAPQYVKFDLNAGIATFDFQSLASGRTLHYAKLLSILEQRSDFSRIRLINLDYSPGALALLCDLESMFIFYAITARNCDITFVSDPQTSFQYSLVSQAQQIKANVTKQEYNMQSQKPFSLSAIYHYGRICENVAWYKMSSEVYNVLMPCGSFAKAYNYQDIAHAIKSKNDQLFLTPEFLDFFSNRISRVHKSVLFRVYLHAIVTRNQYLRSLCEKNLPDDLIINLIVNPHGVVSVSPHDIDIVDALLLKNYGAKLDLSKLSREQIYSLQEPSIKDLCQRSIATLINYKQFLNNLDDHLHPEITLNRLLTFDNMRTVANALRFRPNLLTQRVSNKVLDYIGKNPKQEQLFSFGIFNQGSTEQLEFTPLLEADPNSKKAITRPSGCTIS